MVSAMTDSASGTQRGSWNNIKYFWKLIFTTGNAEYDGSRLPQSSSLQNI